MRFSISHAPGALTSGEVMPGFTTQPAPIGTK